jgi:hypothetical protein
MNNEQQRLNTEERQEVTEKTNVDIQPPKQAETFKTPTVLLQRRSYWASIVSSSVATVALIAGLAQFLITQSKQQEAFNFDREYKTVSLYNEYAKLMREQSKNIMEETPEVNHWIGNTVIFLAETIYKFNSGWNESVKLMLLGHKDFIVAVRLDCNTYTKEFINFTRAVIQQEICKDE